MPLAKPPVRKLARDLGIDLRGVTGTGAGGVITREDLEAHTAAPAPTAPLPSTGGERREPIRGVRDRDLGVVGLHGSAAGAFGHQPALGVGEVDRRPRPAAGAGLRGAAITFTLRWATQIDLPGRGVLLRAGQRVLSPLEQPAGITTTAGCLRAGDRVEVVDHAPQPLDPGPLMEHRVHPGRRRTLLGRSCLGLGEEPLGPGPVRSIGIGVLASWRSELVERLLACSPPARPGGEARWKVLIGTATARPGGILGCIDPVRRRPGCPRRPGGPRSRTESGDRFAAPAEAFAAILVPSIETAPT